MKKIDTELKQHIITQDHFDSRNECPSWFVNMLWLFLLSVLPLAAFSQTDYFQVNGGIPHLPVFETTATVPTPQQGMLVYSVADHKPMMYDGGGWVDLCSVHSDVPTPEDFFVVKDGIPYIPAKENFPVGHVPGSIFYSLQNQSIVLSDGKEWHNLQELYQAELSDYPGFSTSSSVKVCQLPVLGADPVEALMGDIYLSSTERSLRFFDGTAWQNVECRALVITSPVKDYDGFVAKGGGEVLNTEGKLISKAGICWGFIANPDTSLASKTVQLPEADGTFTSELTDLLPKTTYYVRAYAVVDGELIYGENVTFSTSVRIPTIITLEISELTSMSAKSGGDITSDGGALAVTKRGIIWSDQGDPLDDPDVIKTDDGSGVGQYPSTLTELLGNTTYYVRAYAVNSAGTAYGNLIEFTTPDPIAPELNMTIEVNNVTATTAVGKGAIVNNGGALISERGVCVSTDRENYIYFPAADLEDLDHGSFLADLTGLTPGTTYYAKAYAKNRAGIGYSSEISFVTALPVVLTTIEPYDITGSSAMSGGEVTDVGGYEIVRKGICWSTEKDPTVDLATRTSEPLTGDGLGRFDSKLTNLELGTKYYVRAYAENAAGLFYGNLDSLVTLDVPSVVTLEPGALFENSGVGGGNVLSDGGSEVTTRGVCWSTHENPTIYSSHTTDGSGLGLFTSILTGLEDRVTYYVRAYARNSVGIGYGENKEFTIIPEAPKIVTLEATEITSISAQSGGDITSNGGSPITARGIIWSVVSDPLTDPEAIKTDDGSGVGIFPSTLTPLLGSTVYYVRAFAVNSYGKSYGNLVVFKSLPPVPPALSSASIFITDITDVAAVGTMEILNNGGAPVTARGVCISTDRVNYQYFPSGTTNITDIGVFASELTGLTPGTTYYAKGYATNSAGTGYSSETSFVTATHASILTTEPYDVTQTMAQSGGTIYDIGNSVIKEWGVCWDVAPEPTIDGSSRTSDPVNETGLGPFSSSLSGLTPEKTYYVRAYAINAAGVSYADQYSFTTLATTLPEVSTIDVINIGGIQAEGRGKVSNDGGLEVTERGICWSTHENPMIVDQHAESGTGVGNFSVALINLEPGTHYYARAYAINNMGIAYGDAYHFQTPLPAVVRTLKPEAVESSTANGGGEVISDGGDSVTTRGVCWSIFRHPTLEDDFTVDGSDLGFFSSKLTGMLGGTKYFVRAYAENSAGVAYGNMDSLQTKTPVVPTVETVSVANASGDRAVAWGKLLDHGGSEVIDRGICWSKAPIPTLDDDYIACGDGMGEFSGILTGLTKGETYYVRAYAKNHVGISYGEQLEFFTASLATIITSPISSVTGISAVGGGTITSDGGAEVTSSGICWNTTGNPTVWNEHTTCGVGIGEFIHTMTGLMANTTYYVRAYATNAAGTVYGNEVRFISGPPEFAVVKTITSKSGADGRTGYSGGNVISNGGTKLLSGGVCWSKVSGFIPDTVVVNRTSKSVSGSFTSTLENLQPNTTYFVRAFVVNEVGISYAENELSFTTNSIPEVITTKPVLASITSTSVDVGGEVVADGGSPVTASGVCWSTDIDPKLGETNYVSNGPGLGSFTSKINDLMGSTTYYVRAYAINKVGIAYGNVESFQTKPPVLATIITDPVRLNSSTSVTGGGTITSHGGALVTTRGLVWCTEPNFRTDTIQFNRTATTGYFIGSFTDVISKLIPNTVYYVKAYVENSVGFAYGDEVSFKTPVVPRLTTAFTKATGSTTATSGGTISDDGGARVVERGVVWSKEATFDPDTVVVNKTTNGSGVGAFVSYLKGLKGSTTYFIQAYARNIAGTAYGNMLSFITDPPTLPVLKTRRAWNVYGTTAYSGGYISENGGEPITTRGIVWSTEAGFDPDTVVVNKVAQPGTGIGYFTTSLTELERGTTYYIRAFAVNSVGIAYGDELSFTTLDFAEVVTSEIIPSESGGIASGGGEILSDGGTRVWNQGVCWSIASNPTISLHTKTTYDRVTNGVFNSRLTGLDPVTTYFVRAYATNNQGTAYGEELSFTTPPVLPTITTNYVIITSTSSVLTGGDISFDGGADVIERGVVWSSNANFDPDTVVVNKTLEGEGMGTFTSVVNGMNMSMTYYIRAYATNSVGTAFGNQVEVTIFPTAPRLNTIDITSIGGYTAISGGEITSDGGADVTLKGICWSTEHNPTTANSRTYNGSGTDTYEGKLTGLKPNTLYYVRAYAINKIGTAYGVEKSFLTDAFPTLIATHPVTDIIATTATSGGEITDDGRTPILARGVCWSIYTQPTISLTTKTEDKRDPNIGSFVAHMTGMKPETQYYVRSYATNAVGTSYGSQVSFKTLPVMLPMVNTMPASAVDSTHAVCGGEVLNDGGMPVSVRGVCWGLTKDLTVETAARVNDAEGGLGVFANPISGMLPGTKYYFRAFATNTLGPAYGTIDSLVTEAIRPTVTLVAISNLTMTTADAFAAVITDGGEPVTDRGIYWNTTGENPSLPMPADSMISLGTGEPEIEGVINNLQPNTTYYVWAYATNKVGTRFSPRPVSVTTPTLPTVTTTEPKSIARYSSVCGGAVVNEGGVPVTIRGVCYSKFGTPTEDSLHVETTTGGLGAFSLDVVNLDEGTKYYVRAYAVNSMGTGYGELDSLLTLTIPTVETLPADSIWSSGAINGGNVLADGGAMVILRGVCWSSDTIPTIDLLTRTKNGSGLGEFESLIGGLTHATAYYIRAYATNSLGTAYGEVDTIVTAPVIPTLGAVSLEAVDDTTQVGTAEVLDDGGAEVTERGLVWNTEGTPTLEDHVITNEEANIGAFSDTIRGWVEGPTYYVRAYATNSAGTAYGPDISSKSCPTAFTVMHVEGFNGAPETKTVVYHSVSSSLSGDLRCWLTQNLGADQQPTSMNDASEKSAGWYWQFNRAQGYKYDGSREPSNAWTPWTSSISESASWSAANDPCNLLLGLGWRIPTSTEWANADGAPQNWANGADAFGSQLELHSAGMLNYNNGTLTGRGSYGRYWGSTQYSSSTGYALDLNGGSKLTYFSKAYAFPLRCIRDGITVSPASVSNVTVPDSTITETSATAIATIISDGGAVVTERGLCWNTTGTPTVDDNLISSGSGKGTFKELLSNLEEGTTYYVRAYAVNTEGTAYSPEVTSFQLCPVNFEVIHTEGLNGAPVSKTVVYSSVNTKLSGKSACWLTQNLGASKQPDSATDGSEAAAGWYWQFNRSQGYKYDKTRVPANSWTPWVTSISENVNWSPANDPCNLLLGLGWRIPTKTEWTNADNVPQYWTTAADAYNSVLKLHLAGYLSYNAGTITNRGSYGYYWASDRYNSSNGNGLYLYSSNSSVTYFNKANAFPLRCIRDALVKSIPVVSEVTIPTETMTENSADGTATVASNGGVPVSERGLCWSTTNKIPTIDDEVIKAGGGTGTFTKTITGLQEGPTYYVRAYATNEVGTAYSPKVTSFKICPVEFDVIHTAGLNGAAESKVVTYHSVSTNISGEAACWLTQNLGADQQAKAYNDNSEASAGWYWQFNRVQGYKPVGSSYSPKDAWASWTSSISESAGWSSGNDPCNRLLGLGWRIPTRAEWETADAAPQFWANAQEAYASVLKLHLAGNLYYSSGGVQNRGAHGYYWANSQYTTSTGYNLYLNSSTSLVNYNNKAYAFPLRCIRKDMVLSVPQLSKVEVPVEGMTSSSAKGIAVVTTDGGAKVTSRGLCWNTTGELPTTDDSSVEVGDGLGSFTGLIQPLREGITYYVRAYAINSQGTGYSQEVTSFMICPTNFEVIHTAGLNGAAETKTVTYNSVSTNISGQAACWLTQNLGADESPEAYNDGSEASAGWYWQFNRLQGYKPVGSSYIPNNDWTSWVSSISESSSWREDRDPCSALLGLGWRIPTATEWTKADAAPQYWLNASQAYNSVLKLHLAGDLYYSSGALQNRGSYGYYWSSSSYTSSSAYHLQMSGSSSAMTNSNKAYAFSLRCIRDKVVITTPKVSNVTIVAEAMTESTATGTATVTNDGGAEVTDRGLCWNTTGNPTIEDSKISSGDGVGLFTRTIGGLKEGPTYYVRAYATNSEGTAYSPLDASFKICPAEFDIIHTAGVNGAPVNKTVRYHSVSSNISGKSACWLTQNLGADHQAESVSDNSEAAAGWYWQFNQPQGYKNDGSGYVPHDEWTSWTSSISQSSNWSLTNDPCNLLLGLGWRIPTSTEWTNADAAPQYWVNASDAYNSVLKLHQAGLLYYSNGAVQNRGTYGYYWSSTQYTSSSAYYLYLYSGNSYRENTNKAYAFPVRCIREAIVRTPPTVSNVEVPTSGMTPTTAEGTAVVTTDGGARVLSRGLCWNTTGAKPTLEHNVVEVGSGLGSFTGLIKNLNEADTYYVRAYATNSEGTDYSPEVTTFKICPFEFKVIHTEGLNGAPETKTVTYHSISSNISGKSACWLTQNLGSDQQPKAFNDASEASAGWYWQFNRLQGYKYTSSRTPSDAWVSWTSSISESSSWAAGNDPCNKLIGLGWRIPTSSEWTNADAAPQYWTSAADAYNSVLKLHFAGELYYSNGVIKNRGSYGNYWSSSQYTSSSAYYLYLTTSSSALSNANKAYAYSVRCIRDEVSITIPEVSDVEVPTKDMTANSAEGTATVASTGGAAVTERGLCWNTTGNPTTADHKVVVGNGTGSFTGKLEGLSEGPTYFVRAYAINSKGTAYSKTVTSFKICPVEFDVIHTEGLDGAPVSKIVTYGSISSNISGKAACWLTQNLGADRQAISASDNSEAAAGWYWQFNRLQGYKHNGSYYYPAPAWKSWTSSISESANWSVYNDPCNRLLGLGWRIPTRAEWINADAPPQYWQNANDTYNSVLKLHMAGYLYYSNGAIQNRGTYGYYWSSNQYTSSSGYYHYIYSGNSYMENTNKASAFPLRCIRDEVKVTIPSVSNMAVPTSTITMTTAAGTATVTITGGAEVTERGLCWNTTGSPTIADNKVPVGNGIGSFTGTMTGLQEGPTYYVRAYATNNAGTAYSPEVTSFKVCKKTFSVTHTEGVNGAAESKAVTYHSISSTISGQAACWLTQNLGADRQASAVNDNSSAAAGWYWQFNRSQAYKYDGTRQPATGWISSISESAHWSINNDPCRLLLGGAWRIPTSTEWVNADAPPQYWLNSNDAFKSVLKLHQAGYLYYSNGVVGNRGSYGYYWSGSQYTSSSAFYLYLYSGNSYLENTNKAYAFPLRCIKDK